MVNMCSITILLWCWTVATAEDIVAMGYKTTCALHQQSVKCWGDNANGELGRGDTVDLLEPPEEVIDFGTSFVPDSSLDCGPDACCVVSTVGTSKCWGNYKVIGAGVSNNRGDAPNEMGDFLEPINWGSGFIVAQISCGWYFTCALSTIGEVKCVGKDSYAELGRGTDSGSTIGDSPSEMGDNLISVDMGTGFVAVQITCDNHHTCAVSSEGRIKCWGANGSNGLLGQGHSENMGDSPDELGDNLPFTDLGSDFVAVSVHAIEYTTCALSTEGAVKCWGRNTNGVLMTGDTDARGNLPEHMGDNMAAVNLGAEFLVKYLGMGMGPCALSTEGVLKCWGRNNDGQSGYGDVVSRGADASMIGDNLQAVDIGSGFTSSDIRIERSWGNSMCVYEVRGTEFLGKCWGKNGYGHLGYGDTESRGDQSGEMGANLPFVDLKTWPEVVPVCDAADMTNVDWQDMLNENVQSPSLLHSESVSFEASTLSLTFSASLEYVGKSADGNFDHDFNLGTTYWIDFESFSSVDGGVYSPGTCTNRRSADSSGLSFAEMWEYPVNPADLDSVTTAERMAYPPSDWTLNAVNCSSIQYERTLSWADLTSCQDAAGNALIAIEDTNDALKLSGTFFVELVSPYSMSMAEEGYFRTFPVVQQGFEIVLNKQVDVVATTGVQLFISSVMAYGREDDGTYLVTVLIQSADYVQFDLDDAAAVTAPSGITVSAVESFVGDCLVSSSFTCGQIFTAKIAASCSDGGAVALSGSYNFAFTPQCRLLDDGTTTDPACDTFMTTLDESAGKVALGVDASFIDQCDVDLFDVSFEGTVSFYSDDQFAVAVDANSAPFVIGQDTIFGKVTVSMAEPAIDFQLSGVNIEAVYVCTAAPTADLSVDSVTGLGGCLSSEIDDDGPYNVIGAGAVAEYQGTTIDTTEQNEAGFSFLTFDTPRDDIYIHAQALLDVTFGSITRRRRVRMLLQNEGDEANQFRSFVGTASVVEAEEDSNGKMQPDGAVGISIGFVPAMFVIAAGIMG